MLAAIVTSVLILTTADRQCREDQVKRINNAGEPVCCFTRHCDKNHYFEGCQVDNGQDKCLSCHSGEIFPSSFHTKEFDPNSIHCKVPDCQCFEEAVILNEEECPITGKKICQCDRSKLHFGPDPKNCNTALIPCDKIGIELKRNGKCGPCDPGFEKMKADNSTCVPKSTTTTTEPTKTIIVTGTDSNNLTTESSHHGNNLTTESSHHVEGFNHLTVVIPVVGVIFSIIIGIVIVCAVLKRRRQGNINRPRTNGLISNGNVSTRNENSQGNTDIELTVNLIQGGGNTAHENGFTSNGHVSTGNKNPNHSTVQLTEVNQGSRDTHRENGLASNGVPSTRNPNIQHSVVTVDENQGGVRNLENGFTSNGIPSIGNSNRSRTLQQNGKNPRDKAPIQTRREQQDNVTTGKEYLTADKPAGNIKVAGDSDEPSESDPLLQPNPAAPQSRRSSNQEEFFTVSSDKSPTDSKQSYQRSNGKTPGESFDDQSNISGSSRRNSKQEDQMSSKCKQDKRDTSSCVSAGGSMNIVGSSFQVDGNLTIIQFNDNSNFKDKETDNSDKTCQDKDTNKDSDSLKRTLTNSGVISPDPYSPVEIELASDGENTDPKNLANDIAVDNGQRNEECRRLEQRDNESQDGAESESFNVSHLYRGRPVGVAQGQVREHPIDDRLTGNPVAQPNIDDRNAPLYVNGQLLDPPHRAPISDVFNDAPSLHSNFDTQDSGIDRATNGS